MPQAERKRIPGRRIVLLIVTGLVLILIFSQSMLSRSTSAEESGWLTEKMLNPALDLLGFRPISHRAIRKIAHVAEFAVLACLLTLCFYGKIVRSASAGFTAAFLDESIQLVSGREALISDVWIDLIGVALGLILGFLIFRAILRSGRTTKKRVRDTETDAS